MLRTTASTIAIVALVAGSAFAQGNGRNDARNQGIPPGQMPPDGQCRVWHEGRPAGRQPRPTSCNEAERVASRTRNARVIYGDVRYGRDDRRGRDDDRSERNRRDGRGFGWQSVAYNQGHNDGVIKAREDMRDRDRYDPARHGWYKDADRGYNGRYGSKADYKAAYRDGFIDGYDDTYRNTRYPDNRRRGDSVWDILTRR